MTSTGAPEQRRKSSGANSRPGLSSCIASALLFAAIAAAQPAAADAPAPFTLAYGHLQGQCCETMVAVAAGLKMNSIPADQPLPGGVVYDDQKYLISATWFCSMLGDFDGCDVALWFGAKKASDGCSDDACPNTGLAVEGAFSCPAAGLLGQTLHFPIGIWIEVDDWGGIHRKEDAASAIIQFTCKSRILPDGTPPLPEEPELVAVPDAAPTLVGTPSSS